MIGIIEPFTSVSSSCVNGDGIYPSRYGAIEYPRSAERGGIRTGRLGSHFPLKTKNLRKNQQENIGFIHGL